MTLDDLDKLFEEAATPKSFVGQVDYRKGVIAVVRALRDAIVEDGNCKYCVATTAMYNEILGSDAGEKVGTHGSPELDEDARKLEGRGGGSGMTLEELFAPATAAAPAVCVWRNVHSSFGQSFFASKCGKAHDNIGGGICPSCGKPIKFTEAK